MATRGRVLEGVGLEAGVGEELDADALQLGEGAGDAGLQVLDYG